MFGDHITAAIMRDGDFVYAIDIEDQTVRRARERFKPHVGEEIDRISQLIDRDAKLLVVGAHIGMVAIPVSRLCRELWAIEANPRTFELLQYNIKLNDGRNVHALNIVASDREEDVDFVMN